MRLCFVALSVELLVGRMAWAEGAGQAYAFEPLRRWEGLSDSAVVADASARANDSEDVTQRAARGELEPDRTRRDNVISAFSTGGVIPFTVFTYYSWLSGAGGRTWLLTTSHASNWVPFGEAAPAPMPDGVAGRFERLVLCRGRALVFVEEHEQRESAWDDPFGPARTVSVAPWLSRISRVDVEVPVSRIVRGRVSDAHACRVVRADGKVMRRDGSVK